MKTRGFKNLLIRIPALLLLMLMIPALAYATGPRVTGALFSVDKPEIYAVDTAPFISMEVAAGGVAAEITDTALATGGVDVVLTTLPLQRMVKYYLTQENAIAIMGLHFKFRSEIKKSLIFIPVMVIAEKHYYYKGSYPDGLPGNGALKSMKGKRYGAFPGEDVSAYKKAGVEIVYGRTMSILKKLKSGNVDFTGLAKDSVEWLVKKYLPEEKGNFIALDKDEGNEVIFVIFNKKHPDGIAEAEKFRKALSRMVSDGSYLKILKKHMDNQRADEYLKRLQDYKN